MTQQLFEEFIQLNDNNHLTNLFQEMMSDFYPRIKSLNNQIALDLGLLYIYRKLNNDEDKSALEEFWRSKSPILTVQLPMGDFRYRPYLDFIYLDKIMNGLFIETVLEQMSKFPNLSFEESCAILFDLERFYIVPLSEMDVKIIETIRNCIYNQQDYSNEILSNKLDVRSNYISRRIGYLKNNAYFRVTGTVNFPRIGLKQFIILLKSFPEETDNLPDYLNSPYTRTIRRCPNQRFNYIASLTLPSKYKSNLDSYLTKLQDTKIIEEYFFDEVKSLSNNLNFTYYEYSKRPTVMSANKPGFFIDWFKERVQTMPEKLKQNFTSNYHRFNFGGERISLTQSDLKVMAVYRRDMDRSVRTIAKIVNQSWDDTNRQIEKIKKILFPMILLYYMGLNQTAILFFDKISGKNSLKVEEILKRMPQVFSYSLENSGLILTVDLMNGAHRLNDLINEVLPDVRNGQFFLASKTSGIFRLIPYKYYDEIKNEWLFPDDFFLFQ